MPSTPEQCAGLLLDVVPRAIYALRAHMRSHRTPDLTVAQFRTLAFINLHKGVSLSETAEQIGLTLPSMSKMVDGLVARGLIKRESHPSDRRRLTLKLTPKGISLWQTARTANFAFVAELLSGIGANDRDTIAKAMQLLKPVFESAALKGQFE